MDKKKVIYGVGAVALVGIAYYLYNKNKSVTKSTTNVAPPDNSTLNDGTMGMGIVPPSMMSSTMLNSGNTSNVVAVRPSTPIGAGEVVPSTNDVTLFVDPPTMTPRATPYTAYVVGSNSYYFADSTLFTNDVNSILSNASIPLTQKTSAINVLRQLAIDSVTANIAIYGGVLGLTKKQDAFNSINSISDSAIAQVQTQLNALLTSSPIKVTTSPTTTTTSSTPVLTKAFDGSFTYADGTRLRSRKNSLSGFVNLSGTLGGDCCKNLTCAPRAQCGTWLVQIAPNTYQKKCGCTYDITKQ
jgi:hypothetical protein